MKTDDEVLQTEVVATIERTRKTIEQTEKLKKKNFVLIHRDGNVSMVDLNVLLQLYKKDTEIVDKEKTV